MGLLREKTLQRMAAMHAQAQFNSLSNTDEQALLVQALYPEWGEFDDGTELEAGLRVRHDGVLYKVNDGQTHKKQADWSPDVATAVFSKVLAESTDEVVEWVQPDSTNGYVLGQLVSHKGYIWESTYDGLNVWEPGAEGTEGVWTAVEEV